MNKDDTTDENSTPSFPIKSVPTTSTMSVFDKEYDIDELLDEIDNEEAKRQSIKNESELNYSKAATAINITSSPHIKLVKIFPAVCSKSNLQNLPLSQFGQKIRFASEYHSAKKQHVSYVILEINLDRIKIDCLDVVKMENKETCKLIRVYECDENIRNKWTMTKIERESTKNVVSFFFKSKHKKYLKIELLTPDIGVLNQLFLFGFETFVANDITNKIKTYLNKDNICLVRDERTCSLFANSKKRATVTFDCGIYEIEKIYIQFDTTYNWLPKLIKLRFSEFPNEYSFNKKSQQQWSGEKVQYCMDLIVNKCKSFNRYLQLEFIGFPGLELSIVQIRFYGKQYDKLNFDSIQFDSELDSALLNTEMDESNEEKKTEQNVIYAPKIIAHTGPEWSNPDHVWNDDDYSHWNSYFHSNAEKQAFLLIDLGNNEVDSIIIESNMENVYKTLKLLTCDDHKINQWTLICEDNKMDSKFDFFNECKYNIKNKHLKYLKLIFCDGKSVEIQKIILIGENDKHLHTEQEFEEILIEDIPKDKIDYDLIEKYHTQQYKKLSMQFNEYRIKQERIKNDKTKGHLSKEWIECYKKKLITEFSMNTLYTRVEAKKQSTIYGENEMNKLAEMESKIPLKYVDKLIKANFEAEEIIKKGQTENDEIYKDMRKFRNDPKKMRELSEKSDFITSKAWDDRTALIESVWTQLGEELNDISIDHSNVSDVYDMWKDSIVNNPMKLSTKYNVMEYDKMMQDYMSKEDNKKEINKLLLKMKSLCLKSLDERKQCLHKFHIFTLSEYYESIDETRTYPDVYVLFDVENKKIDSIECNLLFEGLCNKIEIFTAKHLIKSKNDVCTDEDDVDLNWNHFESIGVIDNIFDTDNVTDEIVMRDKYVKGISFDQSRLKINFKNERYVRIVFSKSIQRKNGYNGRIILKEINFVFKQNDDDEKDNCIKKCGKDVKLLKEYCSFGSFFGDDNSNKEIEIYYHSGLVPRNKSISDRMRDEICKTLNSLIVSDNKTNAISHDEKHFIKYLLCWQNESNYNEILLTAKRVMNILRKPLIAEYEKIKTANSRLLTLSCDNEYKLPKDIIDNHGLLSWNFTKWYKPRTAIFFPDDIKNITDEWKKLGLISDKENKDEEKRDYVYDFTAIRKKGIIDKSVHFISSDDVAIEYLNLIAYKLNPSFQQCMQNIFEENRKNLNLKQIDINDKTVELGVISGPVKTKARQKVKIKLDYSDELMPNCMAVKDIVRCAIVCKDDKELCSLFDLILNKFKGKILRVKNAFDDEKKGTFGYRAVLINLAYSDQTCLPEKFAMICETQLLLYNYYQVRKSMHLGYGIVRSEEGGIAKKKKPYYVLAQDSCKFGKLDI